MANDRVALAAVIVAGLVGVAGPLITWRATRDVGALSARAELVRGDREDLRGVLDSATSRLLDARGPYVELGSRWERATRPLPDRVYDPVLAKVEAVETSAIQVEIRLGANAPASKAYADALLQMQRLLVHARTKPVPSVVALENDNSLRFFEDLREFRKQAHRAATSVLE